MLKFPSKWRFCPIRKGSKAPAGIEWEKRPYTWNDALSIYESGWVKAPSRNKETKEVFENNFQIGAIGVFCGEASGGLLMLDHDGDSCDALLAEWGEVPETWMVTSGRPGHYQLAYKIPERYWGAISFYVQKTGVVDADGKNEQIEFRWNNGSKGSQSVIYGTHPETGNQYTWFNTDKPIAVAPAWMIEKMLKPEHHHETQVKAQPQTQQKWTDREWALSYLDAIDPNLLDWYTWRNCLFGAHAGGLSESEARQWSGGSSKHTDSGFNDVWQHIKGSGSKIAGLGTLGFLAKEQGWKTPFKPGENHQASKPTLTEAIAAVTAQNVDVASLYAALDKVDELELQTDNDVEFEWLVCNFAHDTGLAQRGFKGEKLINLARARRDQTKELTFVDALEILFSDKEVQFIVGGMVIGGCVGVTSAPGGSGKTSLFYDIAHHVATGRCWSGYPTKHGKVLIVQADEPEINIKQKLTAQGWQDVPAGQVDFLLEWRFTQFRKLAKRIKETKPDLVIIDSWTAVHSGTGADLKDSSIAADVYRLRDLASECGCAIELLHHTNKLGEMRDSSAFNDAVSESRILEPAPVEKGYLKGQFLLKVTKSRSDLKDTYLLEQVAHNYSWTHLGLVGGADDPSGEVPINRIATFLRKDRETVTPWQVAQRFNISPDRAKADLQRLVRWGLAKEEWTIGTNTDGTRQGYFVYYAA